MVLSSTCKTAEAVGIEVFLAQHVVHHDAAARHHVTATLAVGDRKRGDVARGIDDAEMSRAPVAGGVARDFRFIARQQLRIE